MERSASLIPKKPKIYKVPSRFDLTTVLVVTFVYAAFFGVMQAFGVPMEIQAMIIGLLSLVGAIQMFVSERYVRQAAVACGWCVYIAFYLREMHNLRVQSEPCGLVCGVITLGSLAGYIAGVIVAGVFLVSDQARLAVRRHLKKDADAE